MDSITIFELGVAVIYWDTRGGLAKRSRSLIEIICFSGFIWEPQSHIYRVITAVQSNRDASNDLGLMWERFSSHIARQNGLGVENWLVDIEGENCMMRFTTLLAQFPWKHGMFYGLS